MRTTPALAFALLLACAPPPAEVRAQAVDARVADPPAPDALAALPTDLRDKFNRALEEAGTARRDEFEPPMKAAAVALIRSAGMTSDVPVKDLVAAIRASDDRAVQEWAEAIRGRVADDYRRDPELTAVSIEALANLSGAIDGKAPVPERVRTGIEALAALRDDSPVKYTPPEEQSPWTGAVQRALTPEQLAAWQTREAAEKKEGQETVKFLDSQVDRMRGVFDAAMKVRLDELRDAMEPSPDRAAKVEAVGHLAVEQSLGAYRADVARSLRSMSADQRRRIITAITANQSTFSTQSSETPIRQEVWKVGLNTVLTVTDRRRLAALQDERTERRALAMGRMLLVVMDEKVALTAAERDRLLPAAEAAVKQEKALFPPADSQNFNQYSRENFYDAGAYIREETARAILDPLQWQHWQQACRDSTDPNNGSRSRRIGVPRAEDADRESLLAENAEPEEIEHFLSDAFEEKAAAERQRQLAAVMLKAEDIARVAGVGEPAAGRLRTAARGTVEEALVPWKANLAQNVRSQLENNDLENVRNLLANLANMQFGVSDPEQDPENRTLWDKTVDRELTAPQRALWQREVDARAAYKEQAIGSLLLAEFDRRYQLASAQREKLQGMLVGIMRDYGPEIHRMFAYASASTPWYFQSYTMFLPLLGIPEDDLKTMLGKDRWDRWSNSSEHANDTNYWQNVQQMHDTRVKGNHP